MNIDQKIQALEKLGDLLNDVSRRDDPLFKKIYENNPWFTEHFVKEAIAGLQVLLDQNNLRKWISNYPINSKHIKNIGIIMAGNIPAVGFHDLLTVILSGNRAIIKLSHNDDILIPTMSELLISINPSFKYLINYTNSFDTIDAIIATGSDNTSRYFKHKFRGKPLIIRQNRSSCAILDGKETNSDLDLLGQDIFTYFGLGCRNVSKIYLPKDFDLQIFTSAFGSYQWIKSMDKYRNNYIYQKALHSLTNKYYIDGGFFLLTPSLQLVSPIATVYYEFYTDLKSLKKMTEIHKNKIQCMVSKNGWFPNSIDISEAQKPFPWDYSDHIDTMKFLLEL